MSSCFYAVSIIAKRYSVEVERDNILFSIDFLNTAGDNHFFDFMHGHREFAIALATPKNVFSQLHRECATPARRIVLQEQCFEEYPKEASHIHATMVVKTFVLGSDKGVYQVRRKIGIFDFCAVEDVEFAYKLTVVVVDEARFGLTEFFEFLFGRQFAKNTEIH